MNASEEMKQTVEEMGVFFEKTGSTPIHGRVLAFLLIAEPPHKDFYEIQEFLQASKSAISNALKFLSNEGIVDYITFSGDRRRYFRINMEGWFKSYKKAILKVTEVNNIMQMALAERTGSKHLDFNEKLEEMIAFQTYLAKELQVLIQKWEQKSQE